MQRSLSVLASLGQRLLALVEQQRFHWFAPYCGLVGLVILSL
ncbi:MAG: hypothetical protein QF366_01635 [Candidatus Poseidoniia archaeon]|nr:hypothetical protein [Candidatus Poseidoniia archaeon]MDP6846332.1 hypothetical protein [Candidatus Poseidoniia archaeon]MDP7006636.1 hypothetical protein [Candidatus Poseidoniia archaeon]